ncbi:MAG TPA: DoxX family protein [Arenicellales bacterium]|nr:DoxX family protein [Arenicellales bacterium]
MTDLNKAPYAALILRVALGVLALAHGLLKIIVFTPAGTVGFFESLGLPGVLAYPTIAIEVVGGLMLIAGVLTRYVALAMVPVLIGSIVFAHAGAGWLFSNEGGGWEYPAFWSVALIVQAMLGDGALAWRPGAARQRTAAAGTAA